MTLDPCSIFEQKQSSPAETKERPVHEELRQRGLRILVVDDNHDGAMALSTLLEFNGYQTNTAHNGLDSLACHEPE